jgi:hypothetical protein
MTTLISHHPKTTEIALFESDGKYWIGAYNGNMTHQNDEPQYYWIRGDFTSHEEGLKTLFFLTGDEF